MKWQITFIPDLAKPMQVIEADIVKYDNSLFLFVNVRENRKETIAYFAKGAIVSIKRVESPAG